LPRSGWLLERAVPASESSGHQTAEGFASIVDYYGESPVFE
jgi:hypothetical protein